MVVRFEAAFPVTRAFAYLRIAGRVTPSVARLTTGLPAQLWPGRICTCWTDAEFLGGSAPPFPSTPAYSWSHAAEDAQAFGHFRAMRHAERIRFVARLAGRI